MINVISDVAGLAISPGEPHRDESGSAEDGQDEEPSGAGLRVPGAALSEQRYTSLAEPG